VSLTVKESRASFAIEHEENKRDRIQRFAAAMEQRTGQSTDPLSSADLEALQREILGPNALHYGLRRSPVFVGESARFGEERVHYIGPHWDDLPSLLDGLRDLLKRTTGLSPTTPVLHVEADRLERLAFRSHTTSVVSPPIGRLARSAEAERVAPSR
jgi:hypothetical protein